MNSWDLLCTGRPRADLDAELAQTTAYVSREGIAVEIQQRTGHSGVWYHAFICDPCAEVDPLIGTGRTIEAAVADLLLI